MSLESSHPSLPRLKTHRVLACVQCRQRKIKCDRKFPCADCIKSQLQCVPATLAQRQKRRRFPERELLQRLREYEDLLRQNSIPFEPWRKDLVGQKPSPQADEGDDSDDEQPRDVRAESTASSTTIKSEGGYEPKNMWHAMSRGFRDPDNESDSSNDDVRETTVKQAMDQAVGMDDNLLFGSQQTSLDLAPLHPDAVQIFRLWQVYLDNVNPLLKVTHMSSLQGRIIEAASNVTNIDPSLEALMFGIYSMSVSSLFEEDCVTMFNSTKEDLLRGYQFGCQQALLNCGFLRSDSRDCLTALYLYLVSIRPLTMPSSMSALLGVAIRVAQRMGIHSEAALAGCTVLEAEMRRRLWWSLAIFDSRIGEMANNKPVTLDPLWDCRIPLNVNDSELRSELKEPPVSQNKSTDALFAVISSEMGDFLRHASFYLDFNNPALKPLIKTTLHGPSQLTDLENMIETRYLTHCSQDNPLHFITIWTTRKQLAKYRLIEHLSRISSSTLRRTPAQHDLGTSHALRMLDCDTRIMASPLTKGYRWQNQFYYPFPAYIQILQDLRRRPKMTQAAKAWEAMSTNWEAWSYTQFRDKGPFLKLFAKIVLQAWDASEASSSSSQNTHVAFISDPPGIVTSIRNLLAQMTPSTGSTTGTDLPSLFSDTDIDACLQPMTMDFGNQNLPYGMSMSMQDSYAEIGQEIYSGVPGQTDPFDAQVDQIDWSTFGSLGT